MSRARRPPCTRPPVDAVFSGKHTYVYDGLGFDAPAYKWENFAAGNPHDFYRVTEYYEPLLSYMYAKYYPCIAGKSEWDKQQTLAAIFGYVSKYPTYRWMHNDIGVSETKWKGDCMQTLYSLHGIVDEITPFSAAARFGYYNHTAAFPTLATHYFDFAPVGLQSAGDQDTNNQTYSDKYGRNAAKIGLALSFDEQIVGIVMPMATNKPDNRLLYDVRGARWWPCDDREWTVADGIFKSCPRCMTPPEKPFDDDDALLDSYFQACRGRVEQAFADVAAHHCFQTPLRNYYGGHHDDEYCKCHMCLLVHFVLNKTAIWKRWKGPGEQVGRSLVGPWAHY